MHNFPAPQLYITALFLLQDTLIDLMATLFSVGFPSFLGTCQNLGGRAMIIKEMVIRPTVWT